jgi:hypothetical protein
VREGMEIGTHLGVKTWEPEPEPEPEPVKRKPRARKKKTPVVPD